MPSLNDTTICLGKVTYSESSQIVTLFGREHGRIRAIAKGSRREKAGFSGGVDLLYLGNADFITPRGSSELCTLINFNLDKSFPALRKDLLALNAALFLAEFTTDMLEDLDPHPHLFDQLTSALHKLETKEQTTEKIILQYERFLIENTGHMPMLTRCSACGTDTDDIEKPYFSSSSGGIICDGCSPGIPEKRLSEKNVIYALINRELSPETPIDIIIKAHGLLCYHKRALTGRPGKVMGFLNKLLAAKIK